MNAFLDGSYPDQGAAAAAAAAAAAMNGPNGLMSGSKTKRARTSFKHHQLRIMKSHFQQNQNPDSRELKILSQKTGLDKKVLQVWFQNARAKWRRVNAQQGQTGTSSGGEAPPPQQGVFPPQPAMMMTPHPHALDHMSEETGDSDSLMS